MSIKTVCEDLFEVIYKNALAEKESVQFLQKSLENLENTVHVFRLFYYLSLIGKELNLALPTEDSFEKNFSTLLKGILETFFDRYKEHFPSLDKETFVKVFTSDVEISINSVDPYVEDLVLLLLGFLVDKNLSEVFTTTKIKNLIRERLENKR